MQAIKVNYLGKSSRNAILRDRDLEGCVDVKFTFEVSWGTQPDTAIIFIHLLQIEPEINGYDTEVVARDGEWADLRAIPAAIAAAVDEFYKLGLNAPYKMH